MIRHIAANLWLLVLTLVICCVLYPGVLWVIGQVIFPHQAQGSIVTDTDGQPIGSTLIAQPFSENGYFQPRPSAVSYNAAATGGSNWGANNPLLRDRVARALGPIVKYRTGPKKGELVALDVEAWFKQDRFRGRPGIVAQWPALYPTLAAKWCKEHPESRASADSDQVAPFFEGWSREHPGAWPKPEEVSSVFFDMWRQDHPDADLEPVPADMVMASGSGMDPHITLKNALYQLDRVAGTWAERLKRDLKEVRKEIEALLNQQAGAPLVGLAGVPLVNVLEVNLELKRRYQDNASSGG